MSIGDTLAAQMANIGRAMLTRSLPGTDDKWPRLAAVLGRQSIENSLQRLWDVERHPGLARASIRAQLLCADAYVGRDLGRRVDYAWNALSTACHHHAYLLEPTATELVAHLETAAALDAAVTSISAKANRSSPPRGQGLT